MFLFGGFSPLLGDVGNAGELSVGCGKGTFSTDFGTDGCHLCPAGTYMESIRANNCTTCPVSTTTQHEGALTRDACRLCVKDYCHGHGSCTVDSLFAPSCRCNSGYGGLRCEQAVWAIALGSLLAAALVGIVS